MMSLKEFVEQFMGAESIQLTEWQKEFLDRVSADGHTNLIMPARHYGRSYVTKVQACFMLLDAIKSTDTALIRVTPDIMELLKRFKDSEQRGIYSEADMIAPTSLCGIPIIEDDTVKYFRLEKD